MATVLPEQTEANISMHESHCGSVPLGPRCVAFQPFPRQSHPFELHPLALADQQNWSVATNYNQQIQSKHKDNLGQTMLKMNTGFNGSRIMMAVVTVLS